VKVIREIVVQDVRNTNKIMFVNKPAANFMKKIRKVHGVMKLQGRRIVDELRS